MGLNQLSGTLPSGLVVLPDVRHRIHHISLIASALLPLSSVQPLRW